MAPRFWEIVSYQIVGAPASARIDFSRLGVDQLSIRIERTEEADLVGAHVGLDALHASSVTKKEASIALSYPQKRTARRVAS